MTQQIQPITNDSFYGELVAGISGINGDDSLGFKRLKSYGSFNEEFESQYECNTFAANLIDLLPQSMGQHSPIIKYPNSQINGIIQDRINNVITYFIEASKVARLTGGSGILIGGKGDLAEPLQTYIKEPLFYNVLEGGSHGELIIDKVDRNPVSINYLKPLTYRLRHNQTVIHASRILPFYGIKPLTKRQWRINRYWGIPLLVRCYDALENLSKTDAAIAATVEKFSRVVIKIENFNNLSRTEAGKTLLRERTKQINYGWKIYKSLILQLGEEIDTLTVNYEGVVTAAQHIMKTLASKTDIPYSKLFNSSPKAKGLAGSDSDSSSVDRGDERQWADYVNTKQVSDWNPNLYSLIDYHLLTLIGVGNSEKYEIEYPSILQMSESEKAALDKTKAETIHIQIQDQVITPQQASKALADDVEIGTILNNIEKIEPANNQMSNNNLSGVNKPLALIPGRDTNEGSEKFIPNTIIKDSLAVDDSTRAKRKIEWNGFTIALQYFPFDLRHGKMLISGYGYFERTLGADKMAADVYVGTRLHLDKIYAIDQWIDGEFDETKYVIGANSPLEAKNIYIATMPESFIGMLYEVNMRAIYKLRKAYEAKYGSRELVTVDNEPLAVSGELVPVETATVAAKDIEIVDATRLKLYPVELAGIVDPD